MPIPAPSLQATGARVACALFSIFLAPLWGLDTLNAQVTGPDKREAAIFGAILMNADALRKGDVLIRESVSLDTVTEKPELDLEGVTKSSQMLIRFVFDHDAGRYCVLQQGFIRSLDLGEVGSGREPERTIDVMRAGSVSGPESPILVRNFPGIVQEIPLRMRQAMTLSILRYLHAPELRVLPIASTMDEDYTFIREYETRLQSGAGLRKVSRKDASHLELTSFVDYPGGARPGTPLGVEWKYEFDLENSLPVRISGEIRYPTGAEEVDSEPSVTIAKWQPINGIQVLEQMESRGGRAVRLNGKYHRGESLTLIQFHWFSVNDPLDEKFFDGSCFQDAESFQNHIDPAKCGADSLVRPDHPNQGILNSKSGDEKETNGRNN